MSNNQKIDPNENDHPNYAFNPFKERSIDNTIQNHSAKQQKSSNHLLPMELLHEFNINNAVHEEDELFETRSNNYHQFYSGEKKEEDDNDELLKHHEIWNNHTLKAPNIHNKEKYLSLDDLKGFNQFSHLIQQTYTTPIKQIPMMNSQRKNYGMMPQYSPMNYKHNPINYQMPTQIYPGPNYMMPQYIGMPLPQNHLGQMYPIDNCNWQSSNIIRKGSLGEKVLSNPKRMFSSPLETGIATNCKRKTSRKSSQNEKINTFEELTKATGDNLYTYILTQKGSRDAQKILKKISPGNLEILIKNIASHLGELMIDKYANYFCQELIKNCSSDLRMIVLQSIEKEFIEISCHICGTHSLQSFIEISNMPNEQDLLRQFIEKDVITLALNSQGTHVLQKFISSANESLFGKIPEILVNNYEKLINDSFGVCVLIKLYGNITDVSLKEKIIKMTSENILEITQNPFGNYVVQEIIKNSEMRQCQKILTVICANFFSLSMQKYSSNVVESTVNLMDEVIFKKLITEIINSGKLTLMLKNTYGNFVIEKMINRMSKDDKLLLLQELKKSGKDKTMNSSFINLLI